MPQMGPIMWFFLYLFFLSSVFFFILFLYFFKPFFKMNTLPVKILTQAKHWKW